MYVFIHAKLHGHIISPLIKPQRRYFEKYQ